MWRVQLENRRTGRMVGQPYGATDQQDAERMRSALCAEWPADEWDVCVWTEGPTSPADEDDESDTVQLECRGTDTEGRMPY